MSGVGRDIDIMVVGLSGREFAEYVARYLREVMNEPAKVGIIKAQPEKSKHLETATMEVYGNSVDFVGPRAEVYTDVSRVPEIQTASLEEDAQRRDFNFNALFLDLDDNSIKDFTGYGLEDLKNKAVRTPLDPNITFMDDPLRILRAIRLATKLGFTLDPKLIEAAQSPAIQDAFRKKISRERIHDEFRKMLAGPDPVGAMKLLKELGLRDEVIKLPPHYEKFDMNQNSPHHDFTVEGHTLQALTKLQEIIKDRNLSDADKFVLNLSVLCHDLGKLDPSIKGVKDEEGQLINTYHGHEQSSVKAAEYVLRNLPGTTIEEIEKVKKLIIGASKVNPDRKDTSQEYGRGKKALSKFVREMGDLYEHAIDLGRADASGHKINQVHPGFYYESMKQQAKELGPERIKNMKPLLNGQELMTMFNRKGGPWMAKLIAALIDWQLGNLTATKEQAAEFVQKAYDELGLNKVASLDTMDLMTTDFADEFPKHCNVCQKECVGLEDFLATTTLPQNNEIRTELKSNDPGLQCMSDLFKEKSNVDLLYRNCSCGSTLIVRIPCLHQSKADDKALSKRDTSDEKDNWYEDDSGRYNIAKLIPLAEKLPIIKIKTTELMSNPNNREGLTELAMLATKNMTEHDRIHGSGIDHPILIKEDGTIIDGFHRVIKAIMSGTELIPAKRIATKMLDEAQFADDVAGKYEKEKDDPKWGEVLIEKDGVKLTRKQIRDHYIKNATKIMKEIAGKPVMIYILTSKNKTILKRHKDGNKPIIINNADLEKSGDKDNLIYWADRRLASIHFVMGDKTKLGWIDLDIHGSYPREKALKYAKAFVPTIKKELGVISQIFESGGGGYHVQFALSKETDIDELREKLKTMLDEFNKDWEGVTTSIVKGDGMRSDISTLHEKGNLRVPYTLGETWGREKKPVGKLSSRE